VELLVDPGVETDRTNFLHITRLGAERQATERVNDLLISGQLAHVGSYDRGLRLRLPGARALR